MINRNLVLVSQSPRRRELMSLLKFPFKTTSPLGEEVFNEDLTLREQIEAIAQDKAMSVLDQYPDAVLVSADTIIVNEGKVLGKPHDKDHAVAMLKELSGKTHEVITGVCIVSDKKKEVFSVVSKVTFYDITDEDIEAYVLSKEPLDKSGSYSIQGGAALFTKHVEGDYFAIMGLPIGRVYQVLNSGNW